MKKLLGAIAIAAIVATMAPAQADHATGSVLLPAATASRLARCTPDQPGLFGQIINVTAGSTFTLNATGDNADLQDIEIVFYKSMTACEAGADSVAAETDHTTVLGNESGTVPPDANVAIVFLFVGADASFTYHEA